MKIAVLLSGGVDSSVALRLLQQQGHDITAFYLKIWLEDEFIQSDSLCPWQEDLGYARSVCNVVGVPLNVVSLQREYWDHVVSYTISEIKAGRTPNPDIFCNSLIKFGFFFEKIDKSFDKVASGHYAQIKKIRDQYFLKSSPDEVKDQTYFLSYLSQDQLSRILFPIGNLKKDNVRELAKKFDLPNKARKDSQGICFLGKLKFNEFVKQHLGIKKGDFIELESGKKVGIHDGFWFYTIGQRQGIGLSGGPWYVTAKDVEKNIIYISRSYYAPEKKRDSFEVSQINWIKKTNPYQKKLRIKTRHGKNFHDCIVDKTEKGVKVKLFQNDQGIASGQFAVFYEGDFCLGGGVIC